MRDHDSHPKDTPWPIPSDLFESSWAWYTLEPSRIPESILIEVRKLRSFCYVKRIEPGDIKTNGILLTIYVYNCNLLTGARVTDPGHW